MTLARDVLDRILVAKGLISRIRYLPTSRPDRITLARQILTAHDAAELALAAIAHHIGNLPWSRSTYLMDYFPAIKEARRDQDVPGRDYFSQLNVVRINIKHLGIFPDPQQWYRVGERTWAYVSQWCQDYLGISLEDLDESSLIINLHVKQLYGNAIEAFHRDDYKAALEHLAFATQTLFDSNKALRDLVAGSPRAEDAIKLAAFGVHGNDYLALQEFIPRLLYNVENNLVVKWDQEKHGHPANWNHEAAAFCLKTFVEVALRIQDAEWIPGAIEFSLVYEHKITAIEDNVEIVQDRRRSLLGPQEPVVVRTLRKGESIRGWVRPKENPLVAALLAQEKRAVLSIMNPDEKLWGEVEADKVRVTCVPRDQAIVRDYFPDLPEIDYEP